MFVSIMECSTHGKQGTITAMDACPEAPEGYWTVRLVDGSVISGKGDTLDRSILCRRCNERLGFWRMN